MSSPPVKRFGQLLLEFSQVRVHAHFAGGEKVDGLGGYQGDQIACPVKVRRRVGCDHGSEFGL